MAAFATHDVVALGEGNHNNEQGAAFRDRLFHDRRFQSQVRTIVVESGNGRYQAMMDRYISGEDVPEKELRKAWLETTQPNAVWDVPIYEDMFRSVRAINRTLPKERRLRVLLGDTPYPTETADFRSDAYPAGLVADEVLVARHKALIIYGDMHYLRRSGGAKTESIVTLLEDKGVKVFSVWTFTPVRGEELTALQPGIDSWPKPSLTLIRGTSLGAAPFTFYYPKGSGTVRNNGVAYDLGESIGGIMQDQFDALLYLGSKAEITYSKLSPTLCADPAYVTMRAERMSVMRMRDGRTAGDDFRERCKAIVAGG